MNLRFLTMSALALAAIPLSEIRADACGGCFRPPSEVTVVNAHRMVFSISSQRSILWDQFTYTGNPAEFAWVLPVHAASVKVQLAHDEFISSLDAYSTPTILAPPQGGGGGGIGCGSANSASYAADAGTTGVQVISQEVVGPYEVATLASTDPQALESWLAGHGYDVPPSVQPTIAAYVKDAFDFIALRLLPGVGVSAMQPVRVVSDGADPTLPLRMVAAGVGSDVSILLYVISEGRYEAANFSNPQVDLAKLEWNKALAKSNYDTLIQDAMTKGDGRNFVLEFAGHLFSNDFATGGLYGRPTFSNLYYQAASSAKGCGYGSIHGTDFPGTGDAGVGFGDSGDDASIDDASIDDASITDAGTTDAGTDGGTSGSYDQCIFDDLTNATEGMNKNDVVLTRLRADLKTSALDQDLHLKAAADQSLYDNYHQLTQNADGCSTTKERPDSSIVVLALGALAAWFWKRRAR